MKNTFLVLFLITTFLSSAQECEELPKAVIGKRVYDFYNKIDDSVERQMESLLHQYEDSTGFQIAVVTLSDIGDYEPVAYATALGNCWGVGERDVNNGIVFLITFEDRQRAIVTGRTAQIYLTDYHTSRIQQDYLIPQLRAGNFTEGISSSVNAMIETIGWQSIEERERVRAERAQKQKAAAISALWILLGFVLLGLFVWLVILLARALKLRKEILKGMSEDARKIITNLQTIKPKTNPLPKWIKSSYENYLERHANVLVEYHRITKEYKRALSNPKAAKFTYERMYSNIVKSLISLQDSISEIDQRIKSELTNSRTIVVSLKNEIDSLEAVLETRKLAGFRVDNQKEIVSQSKKIKDEIFGLAKNPELCVEVQKTAANELENLKLVSKYFHSIDMLILTVEDESKNEVAESLKSKVEDYRRKLTILESRYPKNLFNNVGFVIAGANTFLSDSISKRDAAVLKISMDKQEFQEAQSLISESVKLRQRVSEEFERIDNIKCEQEFAKANVSEKRKEAEEEIVKAAKKCKDSDVGSSAKRKLKEAKEMFSEAERSSKEEKVNWALVLQAFVQSYNLAKEAKKKAQNDIDEEERRRRRRRNSSYGAAGASLGGSGYSSSSSGSFGGGGFGGGSFGGSGSGGSW